MFSKFNPLEFYTQNLGKNFESKKSCLIRMEFSKLDYMRIVEQREKEFILENFGDKLAEIFTDLRKLAEEGEVCNLQVSIPVKKGTDIQYVHNVVVSYFTKLGYDIQDLAIEERTIFFKLT